MIPQLPTDNLYKFATLGGIILMVFSLWLARDISIRVNDGARMYDAASAQFDVVQTDDQHLLERVNSEINRVKELIDEANKPENTNSSSKHLDAIEAFSELKALHEDETKKREVAYKARVDADTESRQLKRVLDRSRDDLRFAEWGYVSGILIMLAGLIPWYSRHQRYQDDLIRIQVATAKRDFTVGSSRTTVPADTDTQSS